jgi:hypothetical protein
VTSNPPSSKRNHVRKNKLNLKIVKIPIVGCYIRQYSISFLCFQLTLRIYDCIYAEVMIANLFFAFKFKNFFHIFFSCFKLCVHKIIMIHDGLVKAKFYHHHHFVCKKKHKKCVAFSIVDFLLLYYLRTTSKPYRINSIPKKHA